MECDSIGLRRIPHRPNKNLKQCNIKSLHLGAKINTTIYLTVFDLYRSHCKLVFDSNNEVNEVDIGSYLQMNGPPPPPQD